MTYDIAALQKSFQQNLHLYNQWKNTTNNNKDYFTYLRTDRAQGVDNIFQDIENLLEGNELKGDRTDANVLSWDRYLAEGNEIFAQTEDGQILYMNASNGNIQIGDGALNKLANKYNIQNVENFDLVDFNQDEVTFNEFSFMGLGDGRADVVEEGAARYEELDLANNPERVLDIVNEYKKDHGGELTSLTKLFGPEMEHVGQEATNYLDENTMLIKQGDSAFIIKNTDGNVIIDELHEGNIADYFEQIDSSNAIEELSFPVSEEGLIGIDILYGNGSSSSMNQNGHMQGWGDPHFKMNGQQIFDLQGAGGGSEGTYTLLEEDGVEWTSDFVKAQKGEEGSTVMGAQHLKLNTENGVIEVDYKRDGSYTVKLNGEDIDDPSVYGINLSQEGKKLEVTQGDRLFAFNGIDIETNQIKAGAKGILTQLNDLLDGEADEANLSQVMVNSAQSAISAPVKITEGADVQDIAEGFVDTAKTWGTSRVAKVMTGASSDITNTAGVDYTYNPNNDTASTVQEKAELCARIAYAALQDSSLDNVKKSECVANWIEFSSRAMMADVESQEGSKTSIASRFTAGNGYSRSQWNEYMGTVSYGENADIDKNGTKDLGIDVDGDGAIDGYDLDGDGTIQDYERVVMELDEFASHREIISFLG